MDTLNRDHSIKDTLNRDHLSIKDTRFNAVLMLELCGSQHVVFPSPLYIALFHLLNAEIMDNLP